MRPSTRLRPTARRGLPGALALASVPLLLAGCGSDEAGDAGDEVASDPQEGTACEYVVDGSDPAKDVEPPSDRATAEGEVTATIETSAGTLEAMMDADRAPCTVHSFVSLAEQGYFDDTSCHRLVTSGIYVLQCGDPTASGMGGPGYTIPDEVDGSETYPAGTLAMAKTSMPDSGGSQFFVVYQDSELPPDYTVFGTIDEASVSVVEEVAGAGTEEGAPDGTPATPVDITTVTVG